MGNLWTTPALEMLNGLSTAIQGYPHGWKLNRMGRIKLIIVEFRFVLNNPVVPHTQ